MAFCFLLNRLLAAEPWARERLAPFAGERVELRAPPLPALTFAVLPGGSVEAAAGPASLTVTLKPELAAALARGEEHAMRAVHVEGDARFASEVLYLARHLRWDAEEELARLVGDAAAHRLADGARALVAWHFDAARRLADSFTDYVTEEKQVLARRADLAAHADSLARLRDGRERLAKRVDRLA